MLLLTCEITFIVASILISLSDFTRKDWQHHTVVMMSSVVIANAHKFIGHRGGGSKSVNHGYSSRNAVCVMLAVFSLDKRNKRLWTHQCESQTGKCLILNRLVHCFFSLSLLSAGEDCDLLLVTIHQVKQDAKSSQNSEMLVLKNQGTGTTVGGNASGSISDWICVVWPDQVRMF